MDLINSFFEWLEDILPIPLDLLAWILIFAVGIFGSGLVYDRLVGRKCPNCEKMIALRKTGETRFVGETQDTLAPIQEDGFWSKVIEIFTERLEEEEWVCEYCGHRFWKKIPRSNL